MNRSMPWRFALGVVFALGMHEVGAADPAVKIPEVGASAEAFVPAGWTLEGAVQGDLDKDGRDDSVLQLLEQASTEGEEAARILVVALRTKDGTLKRAAVGEKVLHCPTCGGVLSRPAGTPADVTIQKGVIILNQMTGSREALDSTLRFRRDPKNGKFRLIGQDFTLTDRATGESSSVSTNLLTGQRIIEKRGPGRKEGDIVLKSQKKDKVKVKASYLEQVDIDALTSVPLP